MKIPILGNSGSNLEIFEKNNSILIRKKSPSSDYDDRLKKQAEKQENFYRNNPFSFIKVPKINNQSFENGYHFDMEYFQSIDFVSFLQQAEKKEIDDFIDCLKQYLNFSINSSTVEEVSISKIKNKYNEINLKLKKSDFFNKSDLIEIQEKILIILNSFSNKLLLPIGFCHGDLSFSNILFNKRSKEIVFIDFLDSFLESPLLDMVKIRQDSCFHWSFNLYSKKFDRTKIEISLDYIDNKLNDFFSQYKFYINYYQLFQLINFYRIFPYVKKNEIAEYLIKNTRTILNDF